MGVLAFPLSKYAEGRTFLEKDDISPVSAVMHIYLPQICIEQRIRALIHETVVANTQVIQRFKADKHGFSHQSLFCIT